MRKFAIGCLVMLTFIPAPAGRAPGSVPSKTVASGEILYDASVPRDRQIALAMSAAPDEVAADATIYILGKHGYEIVKQGTNGFSCLVEREVVTTREPECFDAEGTVTLFLKVPLLREQLRAEGKDEDAIRRETGQGFADGLFKPPAKAGIIYMLSDENRVYDSKAKKVISVPGHLMFYAPYMTDKDLGYKSGSPLPYLVHPGRPDTLMIVVPDASSMNRVLHKHSQG